MKVKNIVDKSTNRGEFNRAYKVYLESKGKIYCSRCRYHRGENGNTGGYYGGYERTNGHSNFRYPNWKLVSKNRKQWMEKPIKKEVSYCNGYTKTYIDITW